MMLIEFSMQQMHALLFVRRDNTIDEYLLSTTLLPSVIQNKNTISLLSSNIISYTWIMPSKPRPVDPSTQVFIGGLKSGRIIDGFS